VDRDHLAPLLDSGGSTFDACRQAVLAGARFWVAEAGCSAQQLASIYARRHRHTERIGLPTSGFAAAVAALRAHGERPLRVGAVDVDDPPYRFQVFLDDGLSAVVACLGVDQGLGYRVRPGDEVLLACEVVGWMSVDFPGWVRVRLVDAAGRAWFLIDKAPVFNVDLTPESVLPVPAAVRCAVVGRVRPPGLQGRPQVVVSTALDGVAAEDGTEEFTVPDRLLRRVR
jgi:hypothetical protein